MAVARLSTLTGLWFQATCDENTPTHSQPPLFRSHHRDRGVFLGHGGREHFRADGGAAGRADGRPVVRRFAGFGRRAA